ncbi:hypothetical protein MSI_26220 [Treponema sp. JC4]|uniref:hypothetical protein n=1 Tax=Treponema sp. JC4 TaxID=1124982 RepID=UPI00025B0B1E|nr:hypothetical protein [Treponema sp. JC4]EID83967.1 hypothetical protein MSI_26220 [Treponema sp. JC4]
MNFSNLNERIGKFLFTLGFICGICFGLFKMCKLGVETIKEKVISSQEVSAVEETAPVDNSKN